MEDGTRKGSMEYTREMEQWTSIIKKDENKVRKIGKSRPN